MLRSRLFPTLCGLALAGLLAAGCNDDDPTAPGGGGDVTGLMPDFSILDVNPTSATANQQVSPRDYLQQVSGWYFGHAT